MSWPSPTTSCSDVSGANGSERFEDFPASASGAMLAFRLQRAAGEIAIEEAVVVAGRFALGLLENLFVHRRQRAGRIGIAGISRQRKRLAAAAAEIDFAEFAALARFRHPAGAAIAVEGDRKSTRLNSSHDQISYAVFCLKKKKKKQATTLD